MVLIFYRVFHFHIAEKLHFFTQQNISFQMHKIENSHRMIEHLFSILEFMWKSTHRNPNILYKLLNRSHSMLIFIESFRKVQT
jgi:hypothetical protein